MPAPQINRHIRWVQLRDGSVIAYNMRTAEYLEIHAPLTILAWLALAGQSSAPGTHDRHGHDALADVALVPLPGLPELLAGLERMGLISTQDMLDQSTPRTQIAPDPRLSVSGRS
jgi:hypothetical protein